MAEHDAKQDALFVNLVLVFKSAAMQQMGKLINPLTGEVERNLDQARFSIDTLEMLKEKTKGNLAHEIERLLDSTLLELRMNYVEEAEVKARGEPGPKGPAEAADAEAAHTVKGEAGAGAQAEPAATPPGGKKPDDGKPRDAKAPEADRRAGAKRPAAKKTSGKRKTKG